MATVARSLEVKTVLLGAVFFLMSLGLGYPSISRYQPGPPALSDAVSYAEMTEQGAHAMDGRDHWHQRVLVPILAHQIYSHVQGRLGSWDARYFSLLVVNAAFCALTGVLLFFLGHSMLGNPLFGLVAALLFLLDFNTANLYLSGLVDSAELFFVVLLLTILWAGAWGWLAPIAVVGVVAKETFLAYSVMLAGGWWLAQIPSRGFDGKRLFAVAAMGVIGALSLIVLLSILNGHLVTLFGVVSHEYHAMAWSERLWRVFGLPLNRAFWYSFGWLLPLAIPAFFRLPRPFLMATLGCVVGTVVMAVWGDAGDNIGRPLFDAMGPLLCLGASRTLVLTVSR